MGVSNGKITAPVSIGDVSTALGVGNYDLGYLCKNTHGKTNMWSKKKPVKWAQLAPASNVEWWKATNGRYGFIFPSTTVVITNQNDDGVWTYDPPIGGDASPFRLLDFEGYNHNASFNWLVLSVPERMAFSYNSKLTIAGTLSLEASDRLSYYETAKNMYLSIKATSSGTGSSVEKEIDMDYAKTHSGHFTVEFSGEELVSTGIVAGGEIRLHLYGADKDNYRISLRNNSNTKTFWVIKATSLDPYKLGIRNQVVMKNSNSLTELWIYGLYLDLDASFYAGGTLPAYSKIQMYKYVSDTYDYLNYASPIWQMTSLPAMTVAAGAVYTYSIGTPSAITVITETQNLTEVIFIWTNQSHAELARLRKTVMSGSTKPGV